MNTAQQALELLRNKMTGAELDELNEEQRQQFSEICHHWSMLARPANKPASSSDMIEVGGQIIMSKRRVDVALEASWEAHKLAMTAPGLVPLRDDGAYYVVRGVSARLMELACITMSTLGDDEDTEILARKLRVDGEL